MLFLFTPRFESITTVVVDEPFGGAAGSAAEKKHKQPRWKTKQKPRRIPLKKRKHIALRKAKKALKTVPPDKKTVPLWVIKKIINDLSPVPRAKRKVAIKEIIAQLLRERDKQRALIQEEYLHDIVKPPELMDLVSIAERLKTPPPIKIPEFIEQRPGSPFGNPFEPQARNASTNEKDSLLTAVASADNDEELALYLDEFESKFAKDK